MPLFLKNLNQREKYTAFITITVILLALIYGFIIEPLSIQWFALDNEIESKRAVFIKDSGIISKYKIIASNYADVIKDVKPSKGAEQDTADIMSYLETISKNDSCAIMNIKPLSIQNAGFYKEILIEVSAQATMEQFSKFLYDVENSGNMLLKLKRFSINSKSSQAGLLKGTFVVKKILLD